MTPFTLLPLGVHPGNARRSLEMGAGVTAGQVPVPGDGSTILTERLPRRATLSP